jgi:peptidoglycan-associated lipoprotein
MSVRVKQIVRIGIVLLVIGGIAAGCTTKSGTPWWQFWKTSRKGGDQPYPFVVPPPTNDLPGEPPAPVGGEVLPMEGAVPLPDDQKTVGPAADLGIPLAPQVRRRPTGTINELRTIYFDFDSSQLSADARQKLDLNAQFLLANPEVRVQIAGHCDERGTQEYNLSLGERRAASAREYLAAKGVSATQLTVISYGEDRPAVRGGSEEAWRQNRRAEFQVY